MAAEADRAVIWEVDARTGAHRPYATGLRNPTAMAIQPDSSTLWTVVNERDELGPNLVPDYLTSVRQGGFYGWPYSRSEEHTSERQSLMRISYAVFCLKPKTTHTKRHRTKN